MNYAEMLTDEEKVRMLVTINCLNMNAWFHFTCIGFNHAPKDS